MKDIKHSGGQLFECIMMAEREEKTFVFSKSTKRLRRSEREDAEEYYREPNQYYMLYGKKGTPLEELNAVCLRYPSGNRLYQTGALRLFLRAFRDSHKVNFGVE